MKYELNINIEPYSNVIIHCDGSYEDFDPKEVKGIIGNALYSLELKRKMQFEMDQSILVDEITSLIKKKEFDEFEFCKFLGIENTERSSFMNVELIQLRTSIQMLKSKKDKE